MRAWAILAIITALSGGFWAYTHLIASHAADLQASADRAANLEAANQSYIEALAQKNQDIKFKAQQLIKAAEAHRRIDRTVSTLKTQLEEASEDYQICAAMAVPDVVLNSVLDILSETGSGRTFGEDPTSLPGSIVIPADISAVMARDDESGVEAGVD